ncbi:uncharacterized MFS-type transporter C09D4.1-like isoform X1 [Diorhabda sublineata]|uniref:uncharacterized MFS-type transporter C09D4.1-like isoform X1 n=1 Tax=Diorhabda sublineata TaxID=1163346 RepID=UPI0024E0F15C|nr:uncharacterized MFS-type transporter C09D4.1-like isoform X1 [Diorhabda sublineata]
MSQKSVVKVYKIRWLILITYIAFATLSTMHWVEYSIITNIVMKYYHVSASDVNMTSLCFAIAWPIFVLPASFIIDKMGLRVSALIGSVATGLGALIKVFSIGENLFYVVMIGQVIVAISQLFILSLPPKIAVTWFKPQEISTVCSLGLFGITLGSALGFLVPPMVVNDSDKLEDIGHDFKILCWALALLIAPVILTVIVYFPVEPPLPPSQTMLEKRTVRQEVTLSGFFGSIKVLIKNKGFMLHTIAYSCCIGIFTSIGTLLNQIILSYFEGAQEDAGRMGMVMIVVGMIGAILTGFVLDKTHKYKETAFIIFLLSTLAMGGLALALEMKSKWMVYLAISIFGFFLNAYLPAGVEFASELTFPSPESTVTGILMATSQLLSVVMILPLGYIIDQYGALFCVIVMTVILVIGTVLTLFTPNRLNRRDAFTRERNVEFILIKQ